jgi:hypothetical protein
MKSILKSIIKFTNKVLLKMSTEIVRERKNLMGSVRPQTVTLPILFILTMVHTINFNPPYQRELCWPEHTMNGLIGSIMENAIIPPGLLYKYQKGFDKEADNYKYEAPDSKHRLMVIHAFASAKYIYLPGKKKGILPRWVQTDPVTRIVQNVFHHETEDTIQWSKETGLKAYYLTDKELSDFNDFTLDIRIIEVALPYDQRREIFDRLQNGEKNRGTDLLKNKVYCPLIELANKHGYVMSMKENFLKYCSRNAYKYRLEWFTRLWLLFLETKKSYDSINELLSNATNVLVLGDKDIRKMIDLNHYRLQGSPELFAEFNDIVQKFFGFLELLKVKFNPTQMFALFLHFCYNVDFEEILATHMPAFSKAGMQKPWKDMWEANADFNRNDRRHYFIECSNELLRMSREPATPDEKPISKKLKKEVWVKYFGDNKKGVCGCGAEISIKDHHTGHIIARALNGPTTVDNLRPTCAPCNLQMGIQNMDDFFVDKYGVPVTV